MRLTKEQLERAQILRKEELMLRLSGSMQFVFVNDLLDTIEALERERDAVRLEEAEKWFVNWNVDDSIRSFMPWANKRLAELRAALSGKDGVLAKG